MFESQLIGNEVVIALLNLDLHFIIKGLILNFKVVKSEDFFGIKLNTELLQLVKIRNKILKVRHHKLDKRNLADVDLLVTSHILQKWDEGLGCGRFYHEFIHARNLWLIYLFERFGDLGEHL